MTGAFHTVVMVRGCNLSEVASCARRKVATVRVRVVRAIAARAARVVVAVCRALTLGTVLAQLVARPWMSVGQLLKPTDNPRFFAHMTGNPIRGEVCPHAIVALRSVW